jgi:acetolactate synthase-1/2/3 large subunit
MQALGQALGEPDPARIPKRDKLVAELAKAHAKVDEEQAATGDATRVHPSTLIRTIQKHFPATTRYTMDSGKGTFLGVEHLRLEAPRHYLAPVDFSCMGYCIPAAIGAAFAHPGEPVVGLAGDGALLMTGLELITAAANNLPVAIFVLNDGELGQIASFQRTLTNDAPCSVLPNYNLQALAAVGSVPYLRLSADDDPDEVVAKALAIVQAGGPVLVDVAIDYSQKTYFTLGVVKTNLTRLSWNDRMRMVGRAVGRRVFK